MQNRRELVSRRIAILAEQAAGARQAGTRVDLIEAQIEGWTHVLAMFDAGTKATSPRVLVIPEEEIANIGAERYAFPDMAVEMHIKQRLRDSHFDLSRSFTMTRLPKGAVEYRQEPMLPCAS